MGKWWIIPEEIIGRFFEKWKERDGAKTFNDKELITTIERFIKNELRNLDQDLFNKYVDAKNRPSKDTLKRAINARNSPGVFIGKETDKDLLNLICYYAVSKNWLNALDEQSIKEAEIPNLSKKETEKSKYKTFAQRSSQPSDSEVDTLLLKISKCDSSSPDKAEQFYNIGLGIAERTQNEFSRAKINGVYGAFLVLGNTKLSFARQILKDSLDYSRTHSLIEEQLVLLAQLTQIELKIGDPELAGIYIEDYLTITRTNDKVLNEAWAYSILGLIESIKKEDLKSMSYYQMAIKTTKRIQSKITKEDELWKRNILMCSYRELAKIASIEGDFEKARKYLLLALENCDQSTAEFTSIQLDLVEREFKIGKDTTLRKLLKSMRDDKDHSILKESKSDFFSWFINYIKLVAKCYSKDELDFTFRVGYELFPDFKSQKGANKFLLLYAEYLQGNKKIEEAEKVLLEALELESTKETIEIYSKLVSVYSYKNDEERMNKYINLSIKILEETLDETTSDNKKAECFFMTAQLYILKKDIRSALNLLHKTERIYRQSEKIPTALLANTLLSLSWCHGELSNFEKLFDYSLQVIEIIRGTDLYEAEFEARINCCHFYFKHTNIQLALKFLDEADYLNKKHLLNKSEEISYWQKLLGKGTEEI